MEAAPQDEALRMKRLRQVLRTALETTVGSIDPIHVNECYGNKLNQEQLTTLSEQCLARILGSITNELEGLVQDTGLNEKFLELERLKLESQESSFQVETEEECIHPEGMAKRSRLMTKLAEKERLVDLLAEFERENAQVGASVEQIKTEAFEKVRQAQYQFDCLDKATAASREFAQTLTKPQAL